MVYNQVRSKWEKKILWLLSEASLSVIYWILCSGVAHGWGHITPGMLLRLALILPYTKLPGVGVRSSLAFCLGF